MAERHSDEQSHDRQGEIGKALKRRGIIAAAGAAVAVAVAKQVAEPVLAASLLLDSSQSSASNTNVSGPGGAMPTAPLFTVRPILSVINTSVNDDGLGAVAPGYGVYGEATGSYFGVLGVNSSPSTPPAGTSQAGVYGTSAWGYGVYGRTSGTGVVAGVYGTGAFAYGVIGTSTAAGYSGLTGITSTPGVAALASTALVSSAFAAYFKGLTYVEGNFAVTGSKSAAVMHPDGTRRLLYCVESPEAWFEDFGAGKLVGGKADIRLDADFAALIHADDYHVFLTEHDSHHHLAVPKRTASGFTVQADAEGAALKGRKAADLSGTFSWRVVAKRKDNPGKRLEKFVPMKYHAPDPDKLPKPAPLRKP